MNLFNLLPGLGFLKDCLWEAFALFDVGQMFTPPTSKSPWEAMTRGSTGGWAETFAPGEPMGFVGPLATVAAGAIPGVGPLISAAMGAAGTMGGEGSWINMGGYPGTDYPVGQQITGTLSGAAGGYGAGTLGAGVSGGVQSMLTGSTQMGTPGLQGAMGTAPPVNLFTQGFSETAGAALGQYGGFGAADTLQARTGIDTTGGLQPFGGLLGGGAKTGATATAKGGATGIDALMNPATLMGIGGMALSRMPTTPTPPQIGPTVAQWLTKGAITKAGKLAEGLQTEYMGDFELDAETQAYMQAMGGEIDKAYSQRVTTMDQSMGAMNPHWKFSGERLEMVRRIEEERQSKQNLMRSEWIYTAKRQYAQNKYNTVMASINVDETVKRELLFANLTDIMWKYQLDRNDILEFREMARDAGMYLFEKGVASAMA